MPVTLVDPTASAERTGLRHALRPLGSSDSVAALVDNGKPNAAAILRGVFEGLRQRLPHAVEAVEYTKVSASRVLSPDLTDLIARRCQFALVGVGD